MAENASQTQNVGITGRLGDIQEESDGDTQQTPRARIEQAIPEWKRMIQEARTQLEQRTAAFTPAPKNPKVERTPRMAPMTEPIRRAKPLYLVNEEKDKAAKEAEARALETRRRDLKKQYMSPTPAELAKHRHTHTVSKTRRRPRESHPPVSPAPHYFRASAGVAALERDKAKDTRAEDYRTRITQYGQAVRELHTPTPGPPRPTTTPPKQSKRTPVVVPSTRVAEPPASSALRRPTRRVKVVSTVERGVELTARSAEGRVKAAWANETNGRMERLNAAQQVTAMLAENIQRRMARLLEM